MKRGRKFPVIGFILLALGVLWFLRDIGYLKIEVPFLPLVLIIFSIGIIYNRLWR